MLSKCCRLSLCLNAHVTSHVLCLLLLFDINRLRNSNVRVKFVTNSTKEPLRSVHEKLTKFGFDIDRDELFTSLTAARKFVERNSLRPFLLLEESAKEDFNGWLFCVL